MFGIKRSDFPSPIAAIVCLALMAGALAIGQLASLNSFDTRYFVSIVLVIVFALMLVMPSERMTQVSLVLWIITFGFGWRTFHVTSGFSIHPTEVITYFLFLSLLVRGLMRRGTLRTAIPYAIIALVLMAAFALLPTYLRGLRVDSALQEFKVYLTFIPAYFIVQWMVPDRKAWDRIARWCILIGVYVSLLGVMDLVTPELSRSISGGSSVSTVVTGAEDDFDRVAFVFYGSLTAGFLIFILFGFAVIYLLESWQTGNRRQIALSGAAVFIMLAGMYLCGYRGLWYSIVGFFVILAVLQRRTIKLLILTLAALPLLPSAFYLRFQSVFNNVYADSSFYNRLERIQYALRVIGDYPLNGGGYGSAGYVHSDFLQIAATLGIPALLLFLGFLASLMLRLLALCKRSDWFGMAARVLFALFAAHLLVFAAEGSLIWVQLMVPFWFLCGMVYKFFELSRQTEAEHAELHDAEADGVGAHGVGAHPVVAGRYGGRAPLPAKPA